MMGCTVEVPAVAVPVVEDPVEPDEELVLDPDPATGVGDIGQGKSVEAER
jgi:hypothetical protein